MILLPDMVFNIDGIEQILSLQDPYTLNGSLVTKVIIDRHPEYIDVSYGGDFTRRLISSYDETIRIVNKDGYNIVIPMEKLKYKLAECLDYFFRCNRTESVRVGEGRARWQINRSYNVETYIRDLADQCRNFDLYEMDSDYRYYSYEDRCRIRLREQGRLRADASTESHQYNYDRIIHGSRGHRPNYIYHHDDLIISRASLEERFDDIIDSLGTRLPSFTIRNDESVLQSTTQECPKKKYIHPYDYKPEYIKHYMDNEDTTSLLLGAEIEVDCGGKSEEHAKNVLEIVCGIDSNNDALEDKMYCMHDGSLTNGIEFVTMPCTLEYHKNKMNYKEMFKYLDENGYKAHDTTTCGLHIHANRDYLGKSELMQQLTISKILYILEKFNDEICVIARRDNRYSKFVGEGKNEKSVIELYEKYKNKDKYVALNLKHDASIEFRCFRGTLKYETFILTLELVKNIIDYAKSINIEEIELIKWNGLMSMFSDELKEYYNERLEKEKNKKKDSNIKVGIVSADINRNRSFLSVDALNRYEDALNRYISTPSTSCSSYEYHFRNFDFELYDSDTVNGLSNCGCIETQESTINSLKKKIKSLNKKIKHCNNYMEKKQLQKELSLTRKELNILKRERRIAS